jgi:hypothetical protein
MAVIHLLHDTKPAGAGARQVFYTAQVRDADVVFKRVIKYAAPLRRGDDSPIDINLYQL